VDKERIHAAVEISFDRARMDIDVIHGYLTAAYWSPGVPRSVVESAIAHSLCAGAFIDGRQVGFARAITDCATFAYVADVFVLDDFRGRGIGKTMMAALTAHPEVQGLRTWMLLTRDAHGLYRQFGFDSPDDPRRVMIKRDAGVYRR
jgi:GNAT superfamily N-acetyltransferase